MDWSQVLVIILATALAIFLILSIVLVVMLIKVTQQIKSVTEAAEKTVNKVEHAVSDAKRLIMPTLLLKSALKRVTLFKKRRKK